MRRGRHRVVAMIAACFSFFPNAAPAQEAISFGGGACGKLTGGVSAPCEGSNFTAFSGMACSLGRNFLHPLVLRTILDAYAIVENEMPQRTWQYGEFGKQDGGPLWPHKTHQSGVSADFFVPVRSAQKVPQLLSISAFNKFGYGLEFSSEGRLDKVTIDWRALSKHLLALESAGKTHGVEIERIIFTPTFHKVLLKEGPELARMFPKFMKKEAWVRHDEHYHVDFKLPQRYRRAWSCKR